MSLFSIAWKSIRQRGLASTLTGLSVALGTMLMVAVLVVFGIVDQTFAQRSFGYNLIVGPKGSDLDLVLSTVYRIRPSTATLPYKYYLDLKDRTPRVTEAVPIALGDVTEEGSFPIVGTTTRYFEVPYAPNRTFRIRGNKMTGLFDAVIGSRVASQNGWDIGSEFQLVHGGAEGTHVHDEKFRVVAVLAPTGTPNDRTVFINIEGFYHIEGHDRPIDEVENRYVQFYGEESREAFRKATKAYREELEAEQAGGGHAGHNHLHAIPDEMKEVSSVLINTRTDEAAIMMTGKLKRGFQAQAVNPIQPMRRLMTTFVGSFKNLLMVLTAMIIAVSGIGIFVSIYNSMADRRKEIAIMRALGASRQTIFLIVVAESILLCVGGGIIGILMGHGLVFLSADFIEAQTGVIVQLWHFEPAEAILLPALLVLAALVGIIPGFTAYRTDVARSLYT